MFSLDRLPLFLRPLYRGRPRIESLGRSPVLFFFDATADRAGPRRHHAPHFHRYDPALVRKTDARSNPGL